MKVDTSAVMLAMMGVAAARPDAVRAVSPRSIHTHARAHMRREVPQEHSHEKFLTAVNTALKLNNPENIQDAVFSLLGNAAAVKGAGTVTNLDCLQQHVADQAFTNAKAANDVDAMASALVFRTVERNTGSVGLASVICNETATNPEVAALTQHQDPASDNAAAVNKQIALDLAVQLNAIGADPQLALQSGTFAPGTKGDTTGKGNSCDDITTNGCIFDQNLLVEDATADEIDAAVASGGAQVSNGTATSGNAASASGSATKASGAASASSAAAALDVAAASSSATATSDGVDVNAFTGSTGAAPVPVISSSAERAFSVNGATFLNKGAAVQRACDVQKNQCANAANSGGGGSVADCDAQAAECRSVNAKKRRSLGMRQSALDTGSCGSPAIEFANGLDGRKEESFAPVNTADFNHGSALKPAVVTSFICQQLQSKCKAAQATVDACNEGVDAANAATGQAAADAFNSALGV